MPSQKKRFAIILSIAALLLIIPLLAMQFTLEVKWSGADFTAAAVLLFGTGLITELVLRKVHRIPIRIALCATALILLFLVWLELAVGIFGTPFRGY